MLAAVIAQWADKQRTVWSRVQGPNTWCCVFEINWAWATFYAFFLAYGYYGAIAPGLNQYKQEFIASAIQLLMLAGVQVTLGWVAWKYPHSFKDKVKVTSRDLFVYVSLALLLLILTYDRLKFSLFSDEISYAGSAHGHAIYLASAAARHFDWFDDYEFSNLVQATSFLLFAATASLLYVSVYWTPKKRIVVFFILLALGRFIFAIKGGNGSPHPPIQLVPPFVFGSVIGINDISFKLSYFLVYVGFLTLLCRMLVRMYPLTIAYVATLTIGSLPLLLNTSSVVEHSFWSLICFALVFAEIITSTKKRYFRLVGFISIMTMMRQPSFLALLPVFILYFVEAIKEGSIKKKVGDCLKLISLQLLFIPFLATSLIKGTPSTNAWDQGSNTERVVQAIENDVICDSISSAFPFWWLVFIPLSFIPIQRKYWDINIAMIAFFFAAIYVYYSIHPGLWGLAKYQVEYAAPLVIAGFILISKVVVRNNVDKKILLILLFSLLILNVLQLSEQRYVTNVQSSFSRKEQTKSGDEFDILKMGMTGIPYDYKNAYAYIEQKGLSENTYSIGATYGILPEIMNGYTTKAVKASQDIYTGQHSNRLKAGSSEIDVDQIASDSRIKAVILGSVERKQELIALLNVRGWQKVASFANPQYGTSVVIMTRQ